jgi:transcription elongation factor GreA
MKTVREKEVADQVKEARSFGDLSENSEYDEAKNEQAKIEAQIAELEENIAHAKVIADDDIQTDVVNVGVTVTIYDMDFDEEFAYTIVSSREVDPLNNMISDQSPIGRVLIGTKVGDVVSVEVPDGIAKFKVMKIEKKN